MTSRKDKINLEEVIKAYKVFDEEVFISYLKELWLV